VRKNAERLKSREAVTGYKEAQRKAARVIAIEE
jgi:hypothetical protein